MKKYQLNSRGRTFINQPRRNQGGRIGTDFFRSLILIYLFVETPTYRPREFKKFVESLDILMIRDRELMNTRRYPIWKHHIAAAKEELLFALTKNRDGSFSIQEKMIDVILQEVSSYVSG